MCMMPETPELTFTGTFQAVCPIMGCGAKKTLAGDGEVESIAIGGSVFGVTRCARRACAFALQTQKHLTEPR